MPCPFVYTQNNGAGFFCIAFTLDLYRQSWRNGGADHLAEQYVTGHTEF